MRKGAVHEEQMVAIIPEADREPVQPAETPAKTGERSGSLAASCEWPRASYIGAAGLSAVFAARSALSHDSRKATKDATRVGAVSAYPRCGYQRIHIFLGRDNHRMSPGREYRVGGQRSSNSAPTTKEARRSARPRPMGTIAAEPNLVLRLCVRSLRQRPAARVSHRHR
jgi:hypothetical protein